MNKVLDCSLLYIQHLKQSTVIVYAMNGHNFTHNSTYLVTPLFLYTKKDHLPFPSPYEILMECFSKEKNMQILC